MSVLFAAAAVILTILCLVVLRSKQRYSEPGEMRDKRNMQEYGEPVKTLYTSSKVFTLHNLIKDVTNIEGLGWRLEGNFMQLNSSSSSN